MAINKEELLKCRGEDGAKPLNEILAQIVDESNLHDNKTQHMSGDENGTHFINGVYANGNELVADDDYKARKKMAIVTSKGNKIKDFKILFEGNTRDNFTLNENVENFKFIEIYYGYGNSIWGTSTCKIDITKFYTSNLFLSAYTDSNTVQQMMTTIELKNINVNIINSVLYDITDKTVFKQNYISFYKVIGYK